MNARYKTIRRVILTGKEADREEMFQYCLKNRYRITRSGPRMGASYRAWPDSFKIVAEKEIE